MNPVPAVASDFWVALSVPFKALGPMQAQSHSGITQMSYTGNNIKLPLSETERGKNKETDTIVCFCNEYATNIASHNKHNMFA